ncbi:MAG: hypothetical protein ACKVS5_14600 [Parvularculaceae bacterium]
MKRLLLTLLLAVASGVAGAQTATIRVDMSKADQARMGVSVTVLERREVATGAPAIIRVVDPVMLATLDADRSAAAAAAAASQNQLRRAARLAGEDQSASQQSVEAARAQQAADRSRLDLLTRRLTFEWGPKIAEMPDAERNDLLAAIAAGEVALVRADSPSHPEGLDGAIRVETASDQTISVTETLGLSGGADPRMQTIGLYAVARGAAASQLRPGRVFDGRIETSRKSAGVVLPRTAIVRLDGAPWVYAQTGEAEFERRAIVEPQSVVDGWFVTNGMKPGERIVAKGAGSLLAAERAGETAGEGEEKD